LNITLEAAEFLVRSLVFPASPDVDIFITGSLAIGTVKNQAAQDVDFVCHRHTIADQLLSWTESAYFVGSSYKKTIAPGVLANAIVVSSVGEFQAWKIATESFRHRLITHWASKSDRISSFGYVLNAAKTVLCS
jgi:hypothetical protein